MPSVAELSAVYGNFMVSPRCGPGVCELCFNLTSGYDRCYACANTPQRLDAIAPISYSIGGEQLHHALASYKRLAGEPARRFTLELAAVLWRHLVAHEACIARAAGLATTQFEFVTTVPSTDVQRDEHHPLRRIAGEIVAPTRARYKRLLCRSDVPVNPRTFNEIKYEPTRALRDSTVLLIDDTWTTGANAQSAAHALKQAGAGVVAAFVIGRHVNREWGANDDRLKARRAPFTWDTCAYCAPQPDGDP